jgi:hypothetical protein
VVEALVVSEATFRGAIARRRETYLVAKNASTSASSRVRRIGGRLLQMRRP